MSALVILAFVPVPLRGARAHSKSDSIHRVKPKPPCFTAIKANVPNDPAAIRWRNTGICSCTEARARARDVADAFQPVCNPNGSFMRQQITPGTLKLVFTVDSRGNQLTSPAKPWQRQRVLSAGPYFLAPPG
ncbi:hypothetical protein BV898_02777 [Hypsibius exemplaris]|uniref:TonB C-terminal domain-containing protein n=1 Tax=Hypsibius exemplaris TaxID=2072580 RepID=A0A1W0X709_HYPEX|nr:hypothetical protein BV898_02777 [Hypsibius exemplaris]